MMKRSAIHTFGMKCALVLGLQGCSTITYLRVSEPVQLDAVLMETQSVSADLPLVSLECQASVVGERAKFCRFIAQDIEKSQLFKVQAADDKDGTPDYRIKVQLIQLMEDAPGFWGYTFSFLTLSMYPQETRQFYEVRFTGSQSGSPDHVLRSLRFHTIRRFGGLYKLGTLIADLFRPQHEKEAAVRREQQEASQDLYYFLKGSLMDLKALQKGQDP